MSEEDDNRKPRILSRVQKRHCRFFSCRIVDMAGKSQMIFCSPHDVHHMLRMILVDSYAVSLLKVSKLAPSKDSPAGGSLLVLDRFWNRSFMIYIYVP